MKARVNPFLRFALLAVSIYLSDGTTHAADIYWDTNDSATGVGSGTGTWGTDNFWTSDPLGLSSPGSYISGSDVFFSAGTDAGAFGVTVASTSDQNINSLTFQEGATTLSGSSSPFLTLTRTGGNITVNYGAFATVGAGRSLSLAGTLGVTKLGAGTLTLNGFSQNNFTGGLRVNEGTLALDFSSLPSPYTNLIHSGNALSLGGGTISVLGANSAVVSSQTFNGTSINSGLSRILVTKSITGTSTNPTLGTLTRAEAGGFVNLGSATGMGATVSAGGENVRISAPIANKAANDSIVTLSGGGGTALNGGFPYAGHDNTFGTGTVTIASGAGRLALLDGVNISNDIIINGGGSAFNDIIRNFNAAAGQNGTLKGPISINASAGSGGHFASQGAGSTLTLSGSITFLVEVVQRTGTVIYSGGGSYTDFGICGTARLGANNGLATNSTADLGISTNGVLDLAGYNQSLSGITKNTNDATIGNSSTTGFTFDQITGYDTGAYVANFEQSGGNYNLSFTAIPEPCSALLGGLGAMMLLRGHALLG